MKILKKLTIIAIIVLSIYAVFMRTNEKQLNYEEVKYTVQAGDTLYDIANEYASEHQDIREYIFKVKQVNDIDSTLKVGQEIIIFK